MNVLKPLLVISGPTASGKSSLAIDCAKQLCSEVVNVDSIQFYRELSIGSAKVQPSEMQGVPHHLIDIRNPNQEINVAEFICEASRCIKDVHSREKIPIIAGGTTLYLKSLFEGLASMPAENREVRKELEKDSTENLYNKLLEQDSESAEKIHSNDRVRIVRALEVMQLTNRSINDLWEAQERQGEYVGLFIILCWRRDRLYERINQRAVEMCDLGLVEETRLILEKYGEGIRPLKSLGYAQACSYLKGEMTLNDLPLEIAQYTRRFAKRQMTFWRNEPQKLGWTVRPIDSDVKLGGEETQPGLKTKSKSFPVYSFSLNELMDKVSARLQQKFVKNEVWYVDAHKLQSLE